MMTQQRSHGAIARRSRWRVALALAAAALTGTSLAAAASASASPSDHEGFFLRPGNLLVTTGVWTTNADITAGTTQLPPNCATANPAFVTCGTAVAPGTYPIVFNNDALPWA